MITTMLRILESKDMGRLLARRAARLTEAEDTVRPILEAVRTRGDKGLLEYARKFDQLERKSVRVPARELADAAATPDTRIPFRRRSRRTQRPALRRKTTAPRIHRIFRPGPAPGPDRPASRHRRRIHPRRPLSAAFHADHDGRTRAGRGREEHLRRLPESRR